MSTRANIILKEGNDKLFFYRHSDGYPEGTMPTLNKFMDWLKSGKIRENLQQASGWLIILGAMEYNSIPKYIVNKDPEISWLEYTNLDSIEEPKDWKAGAYEITTGIHGDIEWIYEIDLLKKKLTKKRA